MREKLIRLKSNINVNKSADIVENIDICPTNTLTKLTTNQKPSKQLERGRRINEKLNVCFAHVNAS